MSNIQRVPSEGPMQPMSVHGEMGEYAYLFASSVAEVQAAQKLRYEVFNLELKEGLAESAVLGLDVDGYDAVCEHLLILHRKTGAVVGTYRMQTGPMAAENRGYYSEQEFDFEPFEPLRDQMLELGRACVHKDHRNLRALHLLWRGIAQFAKTHRCRYLVGCSSLTSQDMDLGWAMYQKLAIHHLADVALRTEPLPALAMSPSEDFQRKKKEYPPPPKLLRAYLALGGKICGPPAIDREFQTIDFLTVLDLAKLPLIVNQHFFGKGGWR